MSKLLNKETKAAALYQRADECWTEGKLSDAFKLFLAAAKAGYVPAYRILAFSMTREPASKRTRRRLFTVHAGIPRT